MSNKHERFELKLTRTNLTTKIICFYFCAHVSTIVNITL